MNYQMTPDERKAQLNLIVEKMKQNPAITCGILLPVPGESSYTNFSNLAFYGNYTSAFLKKNTHHILPQTKPIYLLNNPQLITCMHEFFDDLSRSPQYKGFSAERRPAGPHHAAHDSPDRRKRRRLVFRRGNTADRNLEDFDGHARRVFYFLLDSLADAAHELLDVLAIGDGQGQDDSQAVAR